MKTALVIRHLAFEDLGLFERTIEASGYQVRYLEAGMDDLSWIEPVDPDLLIILGGPISANDENNYPFIEDELELLQARLNSDLPTLGICLGAQLMARCLGAKIYPGPEKEIGWAPVKLTDAGKASSLKHLASGHGHVLHWHGDIFDIPQGAVHLASSEKVMNQAFSWKKRGLALQFHPEVSAHGMERWYIGHVGEIQQTDDISVKQLRADSQKYAYEMDMHANRFMEDWLNSLNK